MSATQLAAFVVGAVVAALLAIAAAYLAANAKRWQRQPDDLSIGAVSGAAIGLGLLAAVVFGVGACTANGGTSSAPSSRCEAGTYDNGGASYNGPVCVPWPTTGGAG